MQRRADSMGDQLIVFLQTGQVPLKEPDRFRFDRVAKQLVNWGIHVDLSKAREACFHTKGLTKKQYWAMLRLLEIVGRHLSIPVTQIFSQNRPCRGELAQTHCITPNPASTRRFRGVRTDCNTLQ